ncbi:MAG: dienelactone hydrolase family protein [Bacteroidota bacterium]
MHQHHSPEQVVYTGHPLDSAKKVAILTHGRGAAPANILDLISHLNLEDFALVAPAADQHTWYPKSFMAPLEENQPGLDSALALYASLWDDLQTRGFEARQVVFIGFSQGACLTLEFPTRHAQRWGGIVAFSGALIGDRIYPEHYSGSLAGTPIFMGCSDQDSHVPLSRLEESKEVLEKMGAALDFKIYPGMGHTMIQDEFDHANAILDKVV